MSLFLWPKSCILWIIPIAFDCYLLDLSTNLNNWSLNFVEWEFYAWFLTHQPSLRRYLCSIQVGNLNCLKLMLIPVKGFCFVEQAFSLKTILWFIIWIHEGIGSTYWKVKWLYWGLFIRMEFKWSQNFSFSK